VKRRYVARHSAEPKALPILFLLKWPKSAKSTISTTIMKCVP